VEENHEAQYQPIHRQPLGIAREREHRRLPRRQRNRMVLIGRRQANFGARALILNRSRGWDADCHDHMMICLRRSIRHSFVMTRGEEHLSSDIIDKAGSLGLLASRFRACRCNAPTRDIRTVTNAHNDCLSYFALIPPPLESGEMRQARS